MFPKKIQFVLPVFQWQIGIAMLIHTLKTHQAGKYACNIDNQASNGNIMYTQHYVQSQNVFYML